MAKEYIEREAFLDAKRKLYCADCARRKGMKNGKCKTLYEIGDAPCRACGINDVLEDVEDYPAADVTEVRHGRWKPWKYKGMGLLPISGYQCSRCGVVMDGIEDTPTAYHLHYCPNCGARMGESEGEDATRA